LLTRAALNKCGRAKSNFLSVYASRPFAKKIPNLDSTCPGSDRVCPTPHVTEMTNRLAAQTPYGAGDVPTPTLRSRTRPLKLSDRSFLRTTVPFAQEPFSCFSVSVFQHSSVSAVVVALNRTQPDQISTLHTMPPQPPANEAPPPSRHGRNKQRGARCSPPPTMVILGKNQEQPGVPTPGIWLPPEETLRCLQSRAIALPLVSQKLPLN